MPRPTVNEIDDIRRQMALIRLDLHQDVSGVVVGAERAMNWRSYIQNAPWLAIGLGFALGYLVIPRRREPTSVEDVLRTVSKPPPVLKPAPKTEKPQERPKSSSGLAGTLIGLAWPIALRAVQSYAGAWVESLITEQTSSLAIPPHGKDTRSRHGAGSSAGAGI